MLVKFGIKGKEIKEYFLNDDPDNDEYVTLYDVLNAAGATMGDNNIIHCDNGETVEEECDLEDYQVSDGDVVILEKMEFTSQEQKIADWVDNNAYDWSENTMLKQKKLIKELVELVTKTISWDN